MLKTAKITAALCIVASSALSGSHSAGDAAKGEKVFKKCKACHAVERRWLDRVWYGMPKHWTVS